MHQTRLQVKPHFWCHWHYDAKRLTSWQTLCHHAMFLISVLTSWQICWCHVSDIMTIFFNIFADAMTCFWRHSKFVDVMTCFWLHDTLLWHISQVLTNLVTSRRVFDVIDVCWRVFDFMTHGLTSWHIFYFKTNCLHHDVYLTLWLFGLMTNPLTRFWSSWHNSSLFWEQNIIKKTCSDAIANSLMAYHVFDVMTNFFEVMAYFWHTFWHHNVVFFTLFLNIWRIFDVMTNILTSWPVFDIITCVWRHDKLFDVMTHVLTLWRP